MIPANDDRLVFLVMPWIDSEVISIFLSHRAQEFPNDLCVLIFEGAGQHRARDLRIAKNKVLIPVCITDTFLVEEMLSNRRNQSLVNGYQATKSCESHGQLINGLCIV